MGVDGAFLNHYHNFGIHLRRFFRVDEVGLVTMFFHWRVGFSQRRREVGWRPGVDEQSPRTVNKSSPKPATDGTTGAVNAVACCCVDVSCMERVASDQGTSHAVSTLNCAWALCACIWYLPADGLNDNAPRTNRHQKNRTFRALVGHETPPNQPTNPTDLYLLLFPREPGANHRWLQQPVKRQILRVDLRTRSERTNKAKQLSPGLERSAICSKNLQ